MTKQPKFAGGENSHTTEGVCENRDRYAVAQPGGGPSQSIDASESPRRSEGTIDTDDGSMEEICMQMETNPLSILQRYKHGR